MNSITAEVLKQTLFEKGLESIQDFLGMKINPKENKDVTDRRMDEALDQISEAEFDEFCRKYGVYEEEWKEIWM